MYEHLAAVLGGININNSRKRVLSISESKDLFKFLNIKEAEVVEANFPEYNLLNLPFDSKSFDYVVCGQVLEHIEGDPQHAVDETHRVLKEGGIAVFTTCFLNPIHETPKDLWRFTPFALKQLFKKFSKIIDADGWGNPGVLFMIWVGLRFLAIPHAKWHPLHKLAVKNNKDWPILTWIVAQK